ncbi:Msto1 [Acrasis kona]|uniref:Msto1 n=1 Tax=Acrasis kona TaxID=1008807 RepID=A0AAW2YIG2_9EUKA
MFDSRGSLGSLKKSGYQYDIAPVSTFSNVWDGGMKIERQEAQRQTKFTKKLLWSDPGTRHYVDDGIVDTDNSDEPSQKKTKLDDIVSKYSRDDIRKDLEQNATVWSDYLKCHLHPRSICELRDVVHGVDEFEMWNKGHEVMKSAEQEDEFTDSLHFFLEECDSLQCFQVLTNTQDSWGALCEDYLVLLHDEVGSKKPIVTLGCNQFTSVYENDVLQSNAIVSSAYSLSTFSQLSHFLPTFSDAGSAYMNSAQVAATFDSISQSYRVNGIVGWLSTLQPYSNQTVSEISSSLPYPIKEGSNLKDLFTTMDPIHQNEILKSCTPFINRNCESPDPYAHISVMRGFDVPLYQAQKTQEAKQINPLLKLLMKQMTGVERDPSFSGPRDGGIIDNEDNQQKGPYANCTSAQDMMDRYLQQTRCVSYKSLVLDEGLHIPYTFPDILPRHLLNENGFVREKGEVVELIKSAPMLSQVQTTPLLSKYINEVQTHFERVAIKKPLHPTMKFEIDDLKERRERLYDLLDAYEQ